MRKRARIGGMRNPQIHFLVHLGLVSCVLACTFDERDGQVLVALDALTFPIQGEDAKTQCASTASAFGMLGAAISAFFRATALPVLVGVQCACVTLFSLESTRHRRYFPVYSQPNSPYISVEALQL